MACSDGGVVHTSPTAIDPTDKMLTSLASRDVGNGESHQHRHHEERVVSADIDAIHRSLFTLNGFASRGRSERRRHGNTFPLRRTHVDDVPTDRSPVYNARFIVADNNRMQRSGDGDRFSYLQIAIAAR